MAEWTLKYADARGEIHQQVAEGSSERELRDRYTQQGFLVYSIKPRSEAGVLTLMILVSRPNNTNAASMPCEQPRRGAGPPTAGRDQPEHA